MTEHQVKNISVVRSILCTGSWDRWKWKRGKNRISGSWGKDESLGQIHPKHLSLCKCNCSGLKAGDWGRAARGQQEYTDRLQSTIFLNYWKLGEKDRITSSQLVLQIPYSSKK